jgi:hypothetical protein
VSSISTPLFELVNYRHELDALADSGEVPAEQIAETLDALDGDIRDKAVAVAALSRNLDATAEAVRQAAKAMLERADRIERRAESIKSYLLFNMQAAEISRVECDWFTLTVRKNPPAVVIDDESQIPAQYIVQPPPPAARPDKAAISRALKAGEDVPGAHLTYSDRLEIKQ